MDILYYKIKHWHKYFWLWLEFKLHNVGTPTTLDAGKVLKVPTLTYDVYFGVKTIPQ